jgi:DNA-binding transcriptional MerR regulator
VEYRVDELARAAGTTVRNVRAYQDRGLLPPPKRVGRVGWYSDAHLARLRLIGHLLERGYSLQNIAELVTGFERGHQLGDLLGLEAAVASPFTDELPAFATAEELNALFGVDDPAALDEALALGLVEVEGDRFRIPSPRMVHAGAELVRAGVPLRDVMQHARVLRADVDRIAARFVDLVTTHVFGRYEDGIPPPEDMASLTQIVQRLRPLAEMVVDSELARALEQHAHAQLGDRLASILAEGAGEAAG